MIHRTHPWPPDADCPAGPFAVPPMPRIVHLMWLPNWQQVPEKLRDTRAEWCRLNPSWDVRFWNQPNVEELIRDHYPEFQPLWDSLADDLIVKRADLARFLVLHRFGGLYSDMDLMPLRPLICSTEVTGEWVLAHEWTVEGEPDRVCNGFVGSCRRGNPVLLDLLRAAAPKGHWPVLDFLGPRVISPFLLSQPAMTLPWEMVLSKTPDGNALTRNMDSQSWGCPPAPGYPRYTC
jgi:mannosyltransferase OCH1-like enzyme